MCCIFSYVDGQFAWLRTSLFEIGSARYAASLSGHKDAHFDGGKSGAIFFFSKDKRYIIKEVTENERKTLLSILPHYVAYMTGNPESLLPRIMQLCSIRMYRRTLNFMVIENIFSSVSGAQQQVNVVKPSAVYDIKGSWVDRNAIGGR